jgi:Asp-tRNA(Asn)/Glu-tRNA(Gln) amidotransferase A subunit family amidase
MRGVYGYRPTLGRIPMRPAPPDSLLFNHTGPLASCVRNAALFLGVTEGYDPYDPMSRVAHGVGGRSGRAAVTVVFDHFVVAVEVAEAVRAGARTFEQLEWRADEAPPDNEEPFSIYMPLYLDDLHGTLELRRPGRPAAGPDRWPRRRAQLDDVRAFPDAVENDRQPRGLRSAAPRSAADRAARGRAARRRRRRPRGCRAYEDAVGALPRPGDRY